MKILSASSLSEEKTIEVLNQLDKEATYYKLKELVPNMTIDEEEFNKRNESRVNHKKFALNVEAQIVVNRYNNLKSQNVEDIENKVANFAGLKTEKLFSGTERHKGNETEFNRALYMNAKGALLGASQIELQHLKTEDQKERSASAQQALQELAQQSRLKAKQYFSEQQQKTDEQARKLKQENIDEFIAKQFDGKQKLSSKDLKDMKGALVQKLKADQQGIDELQKTRPLKQEEAKFEKLLNKIAERMLRDARSEKFSSINLNFMDKVKGFFKEVKHDLKRKVGVSKSKEDYKTKYRNLGKNFTKER